MHGENMTSAKRIFSYDVRKFSSKFRSDIFSYAISIYNTKR